MQLEGFDRKTQDELSQGNLYSTDQRILDKLYLTIEKMNTHLDNFEYGLAKIAFEEFFWADFCDNYLELIKVRLYKPELFDEGERKKKSGQQTLWKVFEAIIRLIAPYLPHVTEEIYQEYFMKYPNFDHVPTSIHKTKYPEVSDKMWAYDLVEQMKVLQNNMQITLEIVEMVRRYKSESQISMGAELSKLVITASEEERKAIQLFEDDVKGVTKAKEIEWQEGSLGVECVQ
ncbi:MAG: class I tRNA ligase family protein [Candidatus Peribacteria bacterium]|nr:class I tRNA ligase family protein [Candidatus Peribacteria bacterium]